MKLARLHTTNVRGVPDSTYRFACEGSGVTVVTGDAAAGKTSLLRAVAVARRAVEPFLAPPNGAELLRGGAAHGILRAEWRDDGRMLEVPWRLGEASRPEIPAALQATLGRADRAGMGFEWIPCGRRMDSRGSLPLLNSSQAVERGNRYSDSGDKYQGLWRHLSETVTKAASEVTNAVEARGVVFKNQLPDGLARHKAAVAKVCSTIRLTGVETRDRLRPLVWFQGRDGGRREAAELSDSELAGFLFAGAFSWLGLNRSLVLVDTPDLHIHPTDHVRFFKAICDLGAENQIIAATTSPAILDSVAPEQIIDLSKPLEKSE